MKTHKFSLVELIIVLVLFLFFLIPWPVNLYKLCKCDWSNDNWKPEIIHGIGVVVFPASFVTMWFGTDAKKE